jgi:glyoxylase-like metal-dependent hydrolase (beta-lactamase superfamily II)
MGLKIKALHIGDVGLDWSWLLLAFNEGRKTWIPINSFLILGAEKPILVDTGARIVPGMNEALKESVGMDQCFLATPEQDIVKRLREEGIQPEDVGYITHTHLDIEHAGHDDLFPNAKIILQRREMAYAGANYTGHCPDFPWFANNVNRIDFIDGDIELFPGIKFVLSPGHTGGHQHIEVETENGRAILCGDTVYDIPMQLEGKHPSGTIWPPGNLFSWEQLMWQLRKMKFELERGSLILPAHAYEVYDRYGLGKRLGNKRKDYKGFDSYDSPVE